MTQKYYKKNANGEYVKDKAKSDKREQGALNVLLLTVEMEKTLKKALKGKMK